MGRGCKCCDNIKPKLEKIAQERGYNLEFTDVGDVSDLPLDLTGVPYIILEQDGMMVTSFQGDSPEDILRERIEYVLSKHKELISSECDKSK